MSVKWNRNIGLDYSFTFLSNLNLLHALWMIWLSLKGFSLLELGILEGIFHITSFLMEVPTGAVADLWGRKQSRVLGRIFFIASILIMWQSYSFHFQALGFILCAIGYNLESGAGEALVYDSMLAMDNQKGFIKVRGRKELIFQIAFITSFLCGGYLAVKNYNYVFIITLAASAAALLNAILMTEPPVEKKTERQQKKTLAAKVCSSIYRQTKDSLLVLKKEPRIAFLIVFSESIFVFSTTLYFFLQTWWKFEGYTEWYMGIVFAVQGVLAGISGVLAPKVDKKFGEDRLLLAMPFLLLICLWGVALSSYKSLFFALTGALEGILIVAVSDYVNKMVPSEFRATILSFQSMVFSFLMILVFPLIGWIGDRFSLDLGFLLMAGIASFMFFLYTLLRQKKGRKEILE